MRFSGKINSWNAERGFGFIRPADGGQDIFVHMSALPGGEPRPDELLSFEVALNLEGKKKAINVRREAAAAVHPGGPAPQRRPALRMDDRTPAGTGWMTRALLLALLAGLGWAGFDRYADSRRPVQAGIAAPTAAPARSGLLGDMVKSPATPSSRYSCDGRVHCSQMTSCEEATFFLKNCPGTKLDGDNDGVPCEQQWCN